MSVVQESFQGVGLIAHPEIGTGAGTGPQWEYKTHFTHGTYLNGATCIRNNNDILYVTAFAGSRLSSINAVDPWNMFALDSAPCSNPQGLFLDYPLIFVAANGSARVEKFQTNELGSILFGVPIGVSGSTGLTGILDVDVYGDYVYCACQTSNNGVVRVNKNTMAILNASVFQAGGHIVGAIDIDGTTYYACMGNGGNISRYHIDNVGIGPNYFGALGGNNAGLRIRGNYLYTHSTDGTFIIWDITNDVTVVYKSSILIPSFLGPGRLDVYGDNAFICAGNSNAIAIVNIANKLAPFVVQVLRADVDFPSGILDAPLDIVMHKGFGFITSYNSDSIVVIGPPVATITGSLLVDTLIDADAYSFWHYKASELTDSMATDLGTAHNDAGIVGPTTLTTTVGPDGVTYPKFGQSSGSQNYSVSGEGDYGQSYTNGVTFLVVMKTQDDGTGFPKAGTIMRKRRGITTDQDFEMTFFSVAKIGGNTTRSATLSADQALEAANSISNRWYIFEVYFPPGDSTPLVYKDGVQITGANLQTFNLGVRGNNGSGIITVGSNGVGGVADAEGFYAVGAVYMKALTAAQRSAYRAAAQQEGWITPNESLIVAATNAGGVQTAYAYGNVQCTVTGTCYYYSGAWTDAETVGGSLTPGHGGGIQWDRGAGAGWEHIEPEGGPYNVPQPFYTYFFNAGGRQFKMRMGDSAHGDNSGQFNVHVKALS